MPGYLPHDTSSWLGCILVLIGYFIVFAYYRATDGAAIFWESLISDKPRRFRPLLGLESAAIPGLQLASVGPMQQNETGNTNAAHA